jgi:hypothetical protein
MNAQPVPTVRDTTLGGGELAIVLPGTWTALPVQDQEESERRIAAMIRRQVGRNDRLARARREVREQLREVVAEARRADAFSVALSSEILPGVPFPATLILSNEKWPMDAADLLDAVAAGAEVEPEPAAAEAETVEPGPAGSVTDEPGAERSPGSVAGRLLRSFPDASILELSIGPVARRSRVREVQYATESAPELIADYWFPAPDADGLVRAHLTAPMAQVPDLYLELFDAMVDSITFREPLA